jgi:DNA-binding IclR family transcriptional regulator
VVAAISVSTRLDRTPESRLGDHLAPLVVAAADRISYRLGNSEASAYY